MFRAIILIIFIFLECFPVRLSAMYGADSSDSLTDSLSDISDENEVSKSELGKIGEAITRSEPGMHVFIFKVGQGNFCVIKKDARAIIVDAGSSSLGGQDVIEFENCRSVFEVCLGKARIDAVIITHADLDHYSFLKNLAPYMKSECFFILGGSEKHKNMILESIEPKKVCYYLDLAQHFFNFVEEVSPRHLKFFEYAELENRLNTIIPKSTFQFLQPLKMLEPEKKNDYSLVFKLTYMGNSILFTGDANGNTYEACFREVVEGKEGKMESKNENIDALKGINLFMVPHHGADTEGSPIWTDVVIKHSVTTLVGAIVSVGLSSPYKQPTSFLHEKPWPYTMKRGKCLL